jgi:serine/threonine-protein kinase
MPEITEQLKTALADRYVIEQELGAGGMATVYLAHDVKHNRKVALKVLRPELAAVIGAERFLKEIEVTANLQHPHILPLHDSGEADTFLYYVMPYVEGETLRDTIDREKQLSINHAVEITRSVAAALDYAHRKGVIHRDIKPENVLMHDGQPLIADFGIALAVSHAGGTRLTETGLSIGTPHYMSPEQAMGDRELDARSDVYSLGAMLYEMLAGDPPYMGNTAQAIVAKVIPGHGAAQHRRSSRTGTEQAAGRPVRQCRGVLRGAGQHVLHRAVGGRGRAQGLRQAFSPLRVACRDCRGRHCGACWVAAPAA